MDCSSSQPPHAHIITCRVRNRPRPSGLRETSSRPCDGRQVAYGGRRSHLTQLPYVFVSYSQESDPHVHQVLTLVQWLRNHGVEAYVDKFEQSPPESWQLWCYEQIQKASYVLVVCTETYERRVLRQEPGGTGRGATWEGAIITSELYDDTTGQSKFIPVVVSAEDTQHVPFFLKGSSLYDLSDQASRDALYRRLTDQPEYVPEPLGEVVDFPQARLEMPLPVVSAPSLSTPGVQRETQALDTQGLPTRLADIIEGDWVVQIQSPVFGAMMMRIKMSKGLLGARKFEASAIIGPPGWQATGTWEILPGEQVALQGTQMVLQPFPQQSFYQTFNQFFSITPTELHGMSAAQESVIWRRA